MSESLRFDLLATDRASAVFDKVGNAAGATESKFSKLASGLGTLAKGGAIMGAAAIGGGIALKRGLIDPASDLSETVSKTNNVFGQNARGILSWSKTSATSFGLSQAAALGATAQFGDMFMQLGFTGKEAAGTSKNLVKTAADLGSFHNVDPTDVLERIGGALRGEYDSLQQLIPNISAARVEQEAMAATGKKVATELTAQEKATAALAIIQRDGKNAANDFAETSTGAANAQRIFGAQVDDLRAKLGAGLTPVFASVVSGLSGVITTFQSGGFGAAVDLIGQKIGAALPVIQAKLLEWGRAFIAWIGPQIPPMLARLGELAQSLGAWITGTALPWLGAALVRWGRAFVEWIGPMIPPALAALGAGAGRLFDWLLSTGLPRLLTNLRQWGEALVKWIAPMIPPTLAALGGLLGRLVGWILSEGLPKLAVALGRLGIELVQWIGPMIPKAVAALAGLGVRLAGWVVSEGIPTLAAKMLTMGVKALDGLQNGAVNGFQSLLSWLGGLPGKIVSGLGSLSTTLVSAGGDLVRGMINGIKALAGQVADVARDMVSDAVGAIKDKLKIFSPSKVTFQLGQFFGEGFSGGIKDKTKAVVAAAGELAKKATEKLQDLKSQAKQITSGVADAMRGALDVSSLGRVDEDGNRASVTTQLSDFASQAGQFARSLSTAAEKGLNGSLIQRIAQLGPTQGLTAAQALAAMDQAQVASANASLAAVDRYANMLGQTVLTTTSLPEDIARQQGILDALLAIKADLQAGRTINFTINDATDPDKVVAAIRRYIKRNGKLRDVAAD